MMPALVSPKGNAIQMPVIPHPSAKCIGEIDLKPVSELVEQEGDNYLSHHKTDRGVIGKPASDVVP